MMLAVHSRLAAARRSSNARTTASNSASGAGSAPTAQPKADRIPGPDPPPPYCPAAALQTRRPSTTAAIHDNHIDDDDLPDYCECPTLSCPSISFEPPSYTKHTPIGLFPPWKATRPRTLHVRRSCADSSPASGYSVAFPSGNLVLEATQRTPSSETELSLTAPKISTPPLDLVQGADARGAFKMRDQDGAALVRVDWAGNAADVRFTNLLGHTGPARLDVQVVNASLGVVVVKAGDRCVARLSLCGNSWIECLVEEGMDALVVVIVALSMLMMPLVPKKNAKAARHERRALLWASSVFG